MSLINAIICGGGESIEFRMHLRWGLIEMGLLEIIENMDEITEDLNLQTQFNVFFLGMDDDESEFYTSILKRSNNNLNTPNNSNDMILILSEALKNSSSELPFLSILKHLTLLPRDSNERMKYMFVIDKLIAQISLQKEGFNPDPMVALTQIDMRQLMNGLANFEAMNEQESRFQKQLEKTKRLEKEIVELESSNAEALKRSGKEIIESKSSNAEAKVSEPKKSLVPGIDAPPTVPHKSMLLIASKKVSDSLVSVTDLETRIAELQKLLSDKISNDDNTLFQRITAALSNGINVPSMSGIGIPLPPPPPGPGGPTGMP